MACATNAMWLQLDAADKVTAHSEEEFKKIVGAELISPHSPTAIPMLALRKKSGMGWELVACEDILPGTFVGEYMGEKKEKLSPNEQAYSVNGICGFKKRSLVVMANDGFPNMKAYPLDEAGSRVGLFALTKIFKGEGLVWNYGVHHTVKTDCVHQESHLKQLEEYFSFLRQEGSHALYQKLNQISYKENSYLTQGEISTFLQDELFVERLMYILTTPSVLYTLILKKILTPETVIHLWAHPYFVNMEDYAGWPHQFVQELYAFAKKVDVFSEEVIENLLELAEQHPGNLLLSQAEMMLPLGVS
ncbi:MAG: SET domain-containing protein [Chlamydiae bacterium]|nr:SET domain-containing protein [Chlamydiota bacterium]